MSLKKDICGSFAVCGEDNWGDSMMLPLRSAWFSQQNESEKTTSKFPASAMSSGSGEGDEQQTCLQYTLKYHPKQAQA